LYVDSVHEGTQWGLWEPSTFIIIFPGGEFILHSTHPSLFRSESNNGNNDSLTGYSSYNNGNISNNSTLERGSSYKAASRSNSSQLFPDAAADSNGTETGVTNINNNNGGSRFSSKYSTEPDNIATNNGGSRFSSSSTSKYSTEPDNVSSSSRFSSSKYSTDPDAGGSYNRFSANKYTLDQTPTLPSSAAMSRKNSIDFSNGTADLSKRIHETLARHGLEDKTACSSNNMTSSSSYEPSRPTYNGRLSSSDNNNHRYSRESRENSIVGLPAMTGSWRRRHESTTSESAVSSPIPPTSPVYQPQQPKYEIPTATVTSLRTVISRSTSPTLESKRHLRTRIARTTDPIVIEQRRSRKPRVTDGSCQTDTIPEFGTLQDYLNPPPPPTPDENEVG
jgi:hypothetical protein